MDAKGEFALRYYRWALDQWRPEIDASFPLLRNIPDPICRAAVRILDPMSHDERWRMAQILTKRRHAHAAEALGEPLSLEERALLVKWDRQHTEFWRELDSTANHTGPRHKRVALLRAAVRQSLAPVIGREVVMDQGLLYHYELSIGRWTITTRLTFNHRDADLLYDHSIRSSEDSLYLVRSASVEKWFGIDAISSWVDVREDAIPGAVSTLVQVCRSFLEAAPELLNVEAP